MAVVVVVCWLLSSSCVLRCFRDFVTHAKSISDGLDVWCSSTDAMTLVICVCFRSGVVVMLVIVAGCCCLCVVVCEVVVLCGC